MTITTILRKSLISISVAAFVLLATGCETTSERSPGPGPVADTRSQPVNAGGSSPYGYVIPKHQARMVSTGRYYVGPRHSQTYFHYYGTNPTISTRDKRVSEVPVETDNSSFTRTKRLLRQGRLPKEKNVRVEEFINSMDYSYPGPKSADFRVLLEAFPSPNRPGYHLLHIGVQGKRVGRAKRKPANLVFVIDVSGSMRKRGRLDRVQRSLRLLVDNLRDDDFISIVAFNTKAWVALEPTSGERKRTILQAIDGLYTGGNTNVRAGLRVGYRLAHIQYRNFGNNRVILATDGLQQGGVKDGDPLLKLIRAKSQKGIKISSIGVGMGKRRDAMMEKITRAGNGRYGYMNDMADAHRLFVKDNVGSLEVLGKKVKLKVSFNRARISRYRLIGYENNLLPPDDGLRKPGELGPGHAVTALYEVKFRDHNRGNFGNVRLIYQRPGSVKFSSVSRGMNTSIVRRDFEVAPAIAKLSYIAAMFGEKLRGSYWARTMEYGHLLDLYQSLPHSTRNRPDVAEFGDMLHRANQIDRRGDKFRRRFPVAGMSYDHVPAL